MGIDWNKVIEQSLAAAPSIIGAVGIAYWRIRKRQEESIKNQREIKVQLDGHEKMLRRATRAQGRLEGFVKAKREAHNDLEHAVKTVKVAAKRGARRSTDKA
jgi:hypothetical protein